MHEGMMRMMMGMMSGGDRPMDTPMQQMMSPEHIEGRIAFLRTELKVTETQQPLWEAVADALRARAQTAKDVMDGMPGAMMSGSSAPLPLPQRIELYERMLSSRLDGLRQLKVALEPFYAALDDTQKAAADKLLVPAPMGMM
ncbi:Spy/CpxP family protein refolding chaperone [Sinorhizobium sp. KGO-5]|uniref:Spy/CpxP family protein refolding chaperone n=1 Tax=Sinorhizobium sp. KGO-5 TaxID=1470810 RepID=UPI0030C70AF6